MARIQVYPVSKHPDSAIDYGRNWGDNPVTGEKGWLEDGEIIVDSSWEISADRENPCTLVEGAEGSGISANGQVTGIFVEGGTAGIQYTLTNRVVVTNNITGVTRVEKKAGIVNCGIR